LAIISSSPQQHATSAKSRPRSQQRTWHILIAALRILGDILGTNAAFLCAFIWGYDSYFAPFYKLPSQNTLIMVLVLFNIVCSISFLTNGLYGLRRGSSRVDEAYKVFTAISLATLSLFMINAVLMQTFREELPIPGQILTAGWIAAILTVLLLRMLHRSLLYYLRQRGIDTKRVLIVGSEVPGRAVWQTIRRSPELGYLVQGFLSDSEPVGELINGLPVLGRTSQLGRAVQATEADEVIIAVSQSSDDLLELVDQIVDESVEIKVYPDTFQLLTNNEISIGDLSGLPLISVKNVALDNPVNRFLKRSFDIVFSSILLICISPIMLLIAIAIKLDSPGPVFWPQLRVGVDEKQFFCLKFRSMHINAESAGKNWTTPNDPRVTRIGRFIRPTSLDELPQFINVLLGDMSVVGPRPEQPVWVEQFSQRIPRYMRRHREKVGITGWAQVNGLRGDTSIEERTRYDLYYLENWSLLFDIKIILRTVSDIIAGKQENAY
jgi:Undecaprenyl-phosphate glucose phosphotransferase